MKYPYAVMDGNRAQDIREAPVSCHMSREAAIRAVERLNRADPNAHYIAVEWAASRWAREFWPAAQNITPFSRASENRAATTKFQIGDRVRVDGHETTGVVVEIKTHISKKPWVRVLFDDEVQGYADAWLAEDGLHVA